MEVMFVAIKQEVYDAIGYYLEVTNETVSQFLEGIDQPFDFDDNEVDYNLWLRKQIVKLIKSKGVSIEELIKNKDMLMSKDVKEEDGSFYTPLEWARETHKMILRHIPNLEDYIVWDASCGSGNLVVELPKCKQLYVSTLHQEDVEIVKERVPHAHAFQLDFLSGIDYSPFVTEFTDQLPEGLQNALRNNEPILFLMNPPYSVTNAQKTQVSKYLRAIGKSEIGDDLLRQFIWRVYNLVDIHNLTNSYFALIGTNSLFILPSWESTLREMHEHADLLEGFTFPASEFAGVSKSVKWGIFSTIWKTREYREVPVLPKIQLDEKKKDENGNIITLGKFDFVWDKKYITDWLEGKITVGNRIVVPSVGIKGEPRLDSDGNPRLCMGLDSAVGYMLLKNTFKDITSYNAISTTPIFPSDIPVTMENVKDAFGVYAFNSTFQEDFMYSARPFNEPVTGTDEYKEWVANSIYFVICGRKSFLSSFRNFDFNNEKVSINSTIFPFTPEQVKEVCTDPVILEDMEKNPIDNQWYLDLLKEAEPYIWDGVKALYEAVTNFILSTYNYRKNVDYEVHTQAWNAGFVQLKYTRLWNDEMEKQYSAMLDVVRKEFRSRAKTHYIV
jgi:hypothetical protein